MRRPVMRIGYYGAGPRSAAPGAVALIDRSSIDSHTRYMAKRSSLGSALDTASRVKASSEATGDQETLTTAIHIPKSMWSLLRTVAFRRAELHGGRASVSALLVDLVNKHRKELEAQLK